MVRGGYDSVRADDALKQARERGEDVGRDHLFEIAGSLWEGLWFAVLTASVDDLAGHTLRLMSPLLLLLAIPSIAALIATHASGWLVAQYAIWGMTAPSTAAAEPDAAGCGQSQATLTVRSASIPCRPCRHLARRPSRSSRIPAGSAGCRSPVR